MSRLQRSAPLLIVLMVSLNLFAANPNQPSVNGSSVQWNTAPEFDHIQLVIQTPTGTTYSKDFAGGQAPQVTLKDLAVEDAIDGTYSYELRYVPRISNDVKRSLADARGHNDEAAIKRIMRANGLNKLSSDSGVLTVANGTFVVPANDEPTNKRRTGSASTLRTGSDALHTAPNDVVTADDQIIQGSLCVGLDCVNNESFGFDTIRLKENNTRIKFDDTSTSAGFPNVDWQLTANDSASGGANKFSVEDITNSKVPFTITAASPTNSMFVASSGKVGLGNNSPGLHLHITATDTPAIRQEQTSGGGFTAQTWDIGANEANWFVRDLTGGSRLPFRIRPGAPTSSIDISATGAVGIGTASPAAQLDLRGSSATSDIFEAIGIDPTAGPSLNFGYSGASFGRGSAFFNVRPDASAVAPNPSIRFATANVQHMIITNAGFIGLDVTNPSNPIQHSSGAILTAAGTWQSVSSRAVKQNIEDLSSDEAAKAFRELKPVKFQYKVEPDHTQVGFIAEDVPDLVASIDKKTLNPLEIVGLLTKVVKDQQNTIEELQKRIEQLEKK